MSALLELSVLMSRQSSVYTWRFELPLSESLSFSFPVIPSAVVFTLNASHLRQLAGKAVLEETFRNERTNRLERCLLSRPSEANGPLCHIPINLTLRLREPGRWM
jgi:hypothetical protein